MATDMIARAMAGNTKKELDNYKNNPDVADIVQNKAALDAYDTTKLTENDLIKVLDDESKKHMQTYYKWVNNDWSYSGGIGPYYTTTDIDNKLAEKVTKETGKGLSSNDFTDSYKAQVEANTANRHTHSNKELLDTYTQTEANIADAVSKKHSHSNKSVLDATTASYTTEEKTKLSGIESGAEINVQSDWEESDNSKDGYIKNKPYIPTKTSDLQNDSRFIDDTYHDSTKQDVIDVDHKLDADLITDDTSTNKFVTTDEKSLLSTEYTKTKNKFSFFNNYTITDQHFVTVNPVLQNEDTTVNLTSTADNWSYLGGNITGLKPNTTYTISCHVSGPEGGNYGLRHSDTAGENVLVQEESDIHLTFTTDANSTTYYLEFYCNYGRTLAGNFIFRNIMLAEGESAETFVNYNGEIAHTKDLNKTKEDAVSEANQYTDSKAVHLYQLFLQFGDSVFCGVTTEPGIFEIGTQYAVYENNTYKLTADQRTSMKRVLEAMAPLSNVVPLQCWGPLLINATVKNKIALWTSYEDTTQPYVILDFNKTSNNVYGIAGNYYLKIIQLF